MRGFTALSLLLLSVPAGAAGKISVVGAGGAWLHPELGGHGIGLVAYERPDTGRRGAVLTVELNTDTLRLRLDGLRPTPGLEAGAQLAGEALYAGLLPDYYREGRRDPARGFWASYVEGSGWLKQIQGQHVLELRIALRGWFFNRGDLLGVETAPALELPPTTAALEPRLSYTYWRLGGDIDQRHRLFPRVRGLALGLEVGLEARSDTRAWGARDPAVFDPPDPRNDPLPVAFVARQWLRAGLPLAPRLRTQLTQHALFGSGLDDLNRARVGGMNPYVVPLAGAPWAAFLAGRLLAAEWSLHVKVHGEQEVGLLADVAWIDDADRTGRSGDGVHGGLGLFADLRLGAYQIDVRAGWSPTLRAISSAGSFGLFLALGYGDGL